jgi:glycine cleavage system H protein
MIECPEELVYSPRHLWARIDHDTSTAEVGITEELQERLPELLSIDVPMVGDEIEIDQPCVHIHHEEGIRHVRSPLSGRVVAVNRDVLDRPDLLHVAPYGHWLYQMEFDEPDELDMMLAAKDYVKYVEGL